MHIMLRRVAGGASTYQPAARPFARRFWVASLAKGFGFGAGAKTAAVSKRPPLEPGQVSPKRPVPAGIQKPPYADSGRMPPWSDSLQVHNEEGLKRMRASGRLAAQVLDFAGTLIKPGVTTDEIDAAVHNMIVSNNAYPSPLNYGAFPKSVCTSVNECVCHGIPDSRPLQDGDIVNVDVTVFLNGHHGDTSRMYYVGNVDADAKKLCEVTRQALDAAIAICKPGVPYKDIGRTIQNIADKHSYGVVKEYVGHGVGKAFHSAPTIHHHKNNHPGVMQEGSTFTIEPMIVAGSPACVTWNDKWTVLTKDRSLAAQYEHTLLITADGAEILTKA